MIEDELFPCLWHTFKHTRLSSTHTNTNTHTHTRTHTHSHVSRSCINTLGSALIFQPTPPLNIQHVAIPPQTRFLRLEYNIASAGQTSEQANV